MKPIISFYKGLTPDRFGRTINAIWAFDDTQLEDIHNYIQVLFPSRTPSQFVNAPLLDDATVRAFHDDPDLRDRLLRSLDLMLHFYGLRREGTDIVPAEDFEAKARNWLTPYNHNFLRLTRILICLKTLGLPQWADALFHQLQAIYHTHQAIIGAETFRYWSEAVR